MVEDEENIEKMVAKVDQAGIGGIDFEQFKHIMNKSGKKFDPKPKLVSHHYYYFSFFC